MAAKVRQGLKVTGKDRKLGDVVEKPTHYNASKYEVIDVIEDWKLDFHLGNVVKYIARAPHKTRTREAFIQDLEKAAWYLLRKIAWLKGETNGNRD